MNLSDIQQKIYALTGTNSTSYTNAQMLIDLNIWNQKVGSIILDAQDETDFDDGNVTTTYPIYQRALATRKDYAFSAASWAAIGKEGGSNGSAAAILPLKIKRLDIAFDGTNYYKATPIDSSEIDLGVLPNSVVDAAFDKTSPRYDVRYNSIWLYPTPNSQDVSDGGVMRVECERNMIDFSSGDLSTGTLVPGFDSPFHAILAYGPSFEYSQSKQLPAAESLYRELQVYEDRLRKQYSSKQQDRKYRFGADYQSYK